MTEKQAIRQEVLQRSQKFTPAELQQMSLSICRRIEQNERFRSARCVMFFYPLPGEVDVKILINRYYQQKILLLPVVVGTGMELKQFTGPQNMVRGKFGIMEPVGNAWDNTVMPDVIIVPGMAFDNHGHRLGRGRGYYDRFLAQCKAYKIGVCFSFQVFEAIPVEPHDMAMDEIITD